jgi:pulcherriminic acid synthase
MTPPDIFSADFIGDPYPHYRQMRDHHPLYRHDASNAYILSRYDDVRAALTDPDFTTRSYAAQIEPLLGVTLVQRDGQDHARERRLLAAPFRPDRFYATFAPAIQDVADALIDGLLDQDDVELIDAFITPFAVGVLAAVIGLPRSDIGRFRAWYTALLRFGMNLVGDPAVAQAGLAARDQLDAYLRPLVAPDSDGQTLTDDEIVRAAMLMVFAGGETVEKTLATFIRNLLAHPDQLARVRADRALIDPALAESLRYTAPTHMVPRRTRKAATVTGGEIPAEAEVICFLAAANRDERHFARPDRFDISRPDIDGVRAFTAAADHAAFGMGRHFCLGAIMAKTEIHIAVNRLLDALPDIRFAQAAPADHGLFLRGPLRLDVRVRADRSALCC